MSEILSTPRDDLVRCSPGVSDRVSLVRLSWALALIVIGARLCIFDYAGSPLPYFDQWLMEFNNLFMAGLGRHAWWQILFIGHNEHMLVTTRLLSLAGFALNGYWDVKFLVVVAALVRGLEAVLCFKILGAGRRGGTRALVWAACVWVFAAPISGFNLMCGMQVSFFMADIAALWAIHVVLRWRNGGSGAGQLIAASIVGLLSLGSAIAIPAVTLAVHLVQRRARPGFWMGWVSSVLLTGGYVGWMASDMDHSRTFSRETLEFLLQLLAWPVLNVGLGLVLVAAAGLGAWRVLRANGCNDDGIVAGVGLAVFAAVNAGLLALNRMPAELHMRHWDTLSLGTLGVVAAMAGLAVCPVRFRREIVWGTGGLLAVYLACFSLRIWGVTLPYLSEAHAHRLDTIDQYRNLLVSGKIQQTGDRINARLIEKDYRFFDDPVDRYAPHPIVVLGIIRKPLPALALLSPEILPVRKESFTSDVVHGLIRWGWLLLCGGFVVAGWVLFRRRAVPVTLYERRG